MYGGDVNGRAAAVQGKILSAIDAGGSWRAFASRAAALVAREVGGDTWCIATADPSTLLMTDVVAEARVPGSARFFELEYGERDFLHQRDLARGATRSGALSRATGGRLERSARWRELIEPFGMGDQLRAALASKNGCWGYIGIERVPGSMFDARDVSLIADISKAFAEGLRMSMLAEMARTPSSRTGPAFLVLGEDLSVESVNEPDAIFEGSILPGTQPPAAVLSVAARLRTRPDDGPVTMRVASPLGWVVLTASRLRSSDEVERVAIVAQSTRTDIMDLLSVMYRFTPRETQIVRHVLRGADTAEIARALHLSALTVQQHLKSVFRKADVGSRRELVGHVFERHFLPAGPSNP